MTQNLINKICVHAQQIVMEQYAFQSHKYDCKRLRNCTAWVYATDEYFILRSYNTIIAAIHRNSGIGYDFLRYVYGYTATSAQHISKFFNDYNAVQRLRYYPN